MERVIRKEFRIFWRNWLRLLIVGIAHHHKAATIGRGLPAANGGGFMRYPPQ
jgi:hypothetical protein